MRRLLVFIFLLFSLAAHAEVDPSLIRLEKILQSAQKELKEDAYESFVAKFRKQLDIAATKAEPSDENKSAKARILVELDTPAAVRAQGQIILGEGHRHYREGHYKEALAQAEQALRLRPGDKDALALKYSLIGRIAASPSARAQILASRPSETHSSVGMQGPRKIRIEGEAPPLPTPPGHNKKIPLPLAPLGAGAAAVAAAGAAAYAVKRSNTTVSGEDKQGKEIPPASKTEKIIGYVLIGVVVMAVILLSRGMILRALTAAEGLAVRASVQASRLASSEAGALGPVATIAAEEETPVAPRIVEGAQQIIIRRGEYLNRIWDSRWVQGSKAYSGRWGRSFSPGASVPINARVGAIDRGLTNIKGLINNGERGGVFQAKEDIVAYVQKAIDGHPDEIEIVLDPKDYDKLEFVKEMASRIPAGK